MGDKLDYYEVLGVSKTATKDEIRSSYRKLALQYHPDRNKSPDAEERFKGLSEAYAVLSDDEKRKQYDVYGHAGIGAKYSAEDIFRGVDFDTIFRDIGFGFGGFDNIFDIFFGRRRGRRDGPQRGADLRYDLEMTLENVDSGLETEIPVARREECQACGGKGTAPGTEPRRCEKCSGTGQIQHATSTGFGQFIQVETCNLCGGRGTIIDSPCQTCRGAGIVPQNRKILVKIPPGVEEGSRLRLVREGGVGVRRGPPGDLFVVVHVKSHELFTRRGSDLLYDATIGFTQATLGSEIDVPTIVGKAKLKIPSGTQTHTVFRLRGKGLPRLNRFGLGDELVRVKILTPTKLTSKQKDLLSEFAKIMGENVNKPKRFFK